MDYNNTLVCYLHYCGVLIDKLVKHKIGKLWIASSHPALGIVEWATRSHSGEMSTLQMDKVGSMVV